MTRTSRRASATFLRAAFAAAVIAAPTAPAATASESIAKADVTEPIRAEIVSESAALVPGRTTAIGILFRIEPGWHLFWEGCNQTGYPITVKAQLPEGFRALDLVWPAPERLVSPGEILDHVYDDDVLVILPVEAPTTLDEGKPAVFRFDLEWVACREACVAGDTTIAIDLPVAPAASAAAPSQHTALFEAARRRAPGPAGGAPALRANWAAGALVIECAAARSLAFLPQDGCESLVDPIADASTAGNRLEVRYRPVDGRIGPLRGVVEILERGRDEPRYVSIDVPISEDGDPAVPAQP